MEELCQLLRENMAADPRGHKIIVFFTTARLTQFYAELCNLMVSRVSEAGRPSRQNNMRGVIVDLLALVLWVARCCFVFSTWDQHS